MAYEKAAFLLDLALEIAGRHYGMSYSDLDQRSDAPTSEARRRNTQRLVKALEKVFGDRLSTGMNGEGGKCVFLRGDKLRDLEVLRPAELSALDHGIEALAAANAILDLENLTALRTKVRLLAPKRGQAGRETDYGALLESNHVFVRPGPSPRVETDVMRPLTEALLARKKIAFDYPVPGSSKRRTVTPYGIISGYRAYLVALVDGASGENPTTWRIDRMRDVQVLEEPAIVPADFSLAVHARRAFGAYYNEGEFGEVEWRFSPIVADNVNSFRFHPDQRLTTEPDGSVTVRFSASGVLEMAWALYPWGDKVEVIKPEALRRMVEGYRRSDFPGVP